MPAARRAALAATFIQFVTAMPLPAQAQTAGLAPGQWSVGFTHLVVADSTRRLPSGRARPIDIGVWYPTRISGSARLTYRDYVRMTPPPSDSSPSADARPELDGFVAFLESHGAAPDAVEQWLAAPMLATADAPPSGSRFPLVLVAQGNAQTFQDQAPLAEYLASHGYVVATSPSPMRITGPLTDEKEVGARAEEQAVDLAFVASGIAGRPDVSEARIGVVAHSFGARAALLLSMREPRVAAIVSLDGGIGTATGRTSFEALPSYHAGAVRAPILHFCERLDSFMAPGFGLLRTLTSADRWIVTVSAMHHHHFTSLGAVSLWYPALRPALGATAATPASYSAVAGATREFLDAFLEADSASRSHLLHAAWPPLGPVERLVREPK